jgi:hypothetical protein
VIDVLAYQHLCASAHYEKNVAAQGALVLPFVLFLSYNARGEDKAASITRLTSEPNEANSLYEAKQLYAIIIIDGMSSIVRNAFLLLQTDPAPV